MSTNFLQAFERSRRVERAARIGEVIWTVCSDGRNCSSTISYQETCHSLVDDKETDKLCQPPCHLEGCKSVVVHEVMCATYHCTPPPPPPTPPPPPPPHYWWIAFASIAGSIGTVITVVALASGGVVYLVRRRRSRGDYMTFEGRPILRDSSRDRVEHVVIDAAEAVSDIANESLERRRMDRGLRC